MRAFDIQPDELVGPFSPEQEYEGNQFVEKLKLCIANNLWDRLDHYLEDLQKFAACWLVYQKVVMWILERMFFDPSHLDNRPLKRLLECPHSSFPSNFLNVMIGFENDEMVEYFLQSQDVDINAVDGVSSIERCMRSIPLHGQTPLTNCIMAFTPRQICSMKIDQANPRIPLQLFVECQDGSSSVRRILDLLLEYPGLDINKPNAMGWTPLCLSIKQRLWSVVDKLLERGCSPSEPSVVFGRSVSPWFLANEQGNSLLGDRLKNMSELSDIAFECKEMALMEMVRNQNENFLECILRQREWNVDLNVRDGSGYSVFDIALLNDDVGIFYKLKRLSCMQKNADFCFDVTRGDTVGNTLLHLMADKLNKYFSCHIVISGYWDFSYLVKSIYDLLVFQKLKMSASFISETEVLEYRGMFSEDFRLFTNALNHDGQSCLHILAMCKKAMKSKQGSDIHNHIFSTLIDAYEADINLKIQKWKNKVWSVPREYDFQNVFMLAMLRQNSAMLKYLLDHHSHKLDLDARDWRGNSLLHIALGCPIHGIGLMENILRLWKKSSASFDIVNCQNKEGHTVLHIAAKSARSFEDPVFRLLQVYQPRLDLQDKDGNTPLMLALKNGKYDQGLLRYLSENIDFDLVDGMNANIFHILANSLFGETSLTFYEYLLELNGDVNKALNHRDLDGNTPLVHACRRNNQKLCLEFLQKGAMWYGLNFLQRDVLYYAGDELKAFLFEKHIWKAKCGVFQEGLVVSAFNQSLVRTLDCDIVNTIFNVGKKHFFRPGSI